MQKSTAAAQHQLSSSDSASPPVAQPPNTTPRLIAMAASLVGDETKVMEHLRCSEADFLLYCSGQKELPFAELDRLVSLIVHEQGVLIAQHRQFLAEVRARRNPRD